MRRVARVLGAAVLVVAPLLFTVGPAIPSAPPPPCVTPGPTNPPLTPTADFLTGGGFILLPDASTSPVVHANFGVGGGCKQGGDGHGLWGHLEYIDHGSALTGGAMLNVHWTTITAYMTDNSTDPNARIICGTATTNSPSPSIPPMVNFAVRATDDDQSVGMDEFDIQLTDPASPSNAVVYSTNPGFALSPHTLAGGNIILHEPNPSTMGAISVSCPALGGGIS